MNIEQQQRMLNVIENCNQANVNVCRKTLRISNAFHLAYLNIQVQNQ